MSADISGAVVHSNPADGYKSLIAIENFNIGEVFSPFTHLSVHSQPSRYTIQTGENQHIEVLPTMLRYINHSCSPKLFFDTQRMQVICLQTIKSGDVLTYFYPSTEWEMVETFECNCGSANCLRAIRGAAWLSKDIIGKHRFTDFISKKLQLLHG